MNDFTKEELEIIAINICCNEKTADLLNKINSMIDNYCDHNDSRITHDYDVEKCNLCGILFV